MSGDLTSVERMKFSLFFGGLAISPEALAFIASRCGHRPLTLADYASTRGVSLMLEGDVWVNAPVAAHNPNMVLGPKHLLRADGDGLSVVDTETGAEVPAKFAPIPDYFAERNADGALYTDFIHTHTDRARLSPVRGCAMRCKFCDIPYEFRSRYFTKPIGSLLDAVARSLADEVQPASHLLISGGTPRKENHTYLHEIYRAVLTNFPTVDVDIMMAPVPGIIDILALAKLGVHELSLNLERLTEKALSDFSLL